jgi:hypothetical protein
LKWCWTGGTISSETKREGEHALRQTGGHPYGTPPALDHSRSINSRTHVPQKLTGLISLYTNPVSILTALFKPPVKALNPLNRLTQSLVGGTYHLEIPLSIQFVRCVLLLLVHPFTLRRRRPGFRVPVGSHTSAWTRRPRPAASPPPRAPAAPRETALPLWRT